MATLNHVPRQYADLIIICGPPRSGTTWLNRELCKLPTAFQFLPECTLITQQIELYSQTLHYCDPQRLHSYFSNHENLQCYYRTNVARLIDQVATINQKKNASTLVLKDPIDPKSVVLISPEAATACADFIISVSVSTLSDNCIAPK